jgi:chemotaxis protein MotB
VNLPPVDEEESADATRLWMVPYADLMSTFVILFLILLSNLIYENPGRYQRALELIKSEAFTNMFKEAAPPKEEPAREKPRNLEEEIKRLKLDEFGVNSTARFVRLSLPAPVLFDFGSGKLSPRASPALESLGRLLEEFPNPVIVEGHTDDRPVRRGPWRDNWELSAARALAVVECLAARGLDPKRFSARGYADQRPLSPESNATREGRARNRRIEILLLREMRGENEGK